MKHYNTSQARIHLNEIVNKVKYEKIIISIGRRNKSEALLVPAPEKDEKLPITEINAQSKSFKFLEEETDIYSLKDIKKRYV